MNSGSSCWRSGLGSEVGSSGAYTRRFLIAASKPAFDFVLADDDASDRDRAIPAELSVEQCLRRRCRRKATR